MLDSAFTSPTDSSVDLLGVLAELGMLGGEESSWAEAVGQGD